MSDFKVRNIIPCIVMPNRVFLIGVILGMMLGRKIELGNKPAPIEPIHMGKEENKEEDLSMYHGSLLHFHCEKCGRVYYFENLDQIPEQSLECETVECDNILILYGEMEYKNMTMGQFRLV